MVQKLDNDWGIDLSLLVSGVTVPHLGGNKYYKLLGYLEDARSRGCRRLVTMAAAHSNHLRAFAAICAREGFEGTAFIRGEELADPGRQSAEIRFALASGIRCIFIERSRYRELRALDDTGAVEKLVPGLNLADALFIPEGGLGPPAMSGVTQWARQAQGFDQVFLACATGTTCAGFLAATENPTQIVGVAVLRNAPAIHAAIATLVPKQRNRFCLLEQYDFGGFARASAELRLFCDQLSEKWQLRVDTSYVGKAAWAIARQAESGWIQGKTLLVYTYNE